MNLEIFFDDKDKPQNIPDCLTIIQKRREIGSSQVTATNVTGVRIRLDKKSDGDVSDVWVKAHYGVLMTEAATQNFVARYLEQHNVSTVRAPRVYLAFNWGQKGFIVTEFIDGDTCSLDDDALIAAAVADLIQIKGPSPQLGPLGGGCIEHPFFIERKSSVNYESVEALQNHINNILRITGWKQRVDLVGEVAQYGLPLCPSDLNYVNFMKDQDGRIVAIDFGGYSFLPPSFFGLAMRTTVLGQVIRLMLDESSLRNQCKRNVDALENASLALVPYGTNNIGMKKPASKSR